MRNIYGMRIKEECFGFGLKIKIESKADKIPVVYWIKDIHQVYIHASPSVGHWWVSWEKRKKS